MIKKILPELVASQPQIGHAMKSTQTFHEGHKMHPVSSNYFNRHALQTKNIRVKTRKSIRKDAQQQHGQRQHFSLTSHSAYVATSTESDGVKIDGLAKKIITKHCEKKTFFKIITEEERWRNFLLTFSESTKIWC